MSDHNHNESEWPIIWEIKDLQGKRLTMLVAHTEAEARKFADYLYQDQYAIIDTGKRKPPNKCCNRCGDKPCGS